MDDTVSWCKTGLQELNSLAQDRRLQDKQWTLMGAGPMVPEKEEEKALRGSIGRAVDPLSVSVCPDDKF